MVHTQDREALTESLASAGFRVEPGREVGGRAALVARRVDSSWEWGASRLHTFVVVFSARELTPETADTLTAAAQRYAIRHKGGLPRGLLNATATVATFLSTSVPAEVTEWFEEEPRHRYAALRLPVLADLEAHQLTWFDNRMPRGYVYQSHLHHIVRDVIGPGLDCAS